MAAGPRYISSARTAQETSLPVFLLLLGDVAVRADRTKIASSVACVVVVTLKNYLLRRNIVTALSSD
jgi:hypothetical protein